MKRVLCTYIYTYFHKGFIYLFFSGTDNAKSSLKMLQFMLTPDNEVWKLLYTRISSVGIVFISELAYVIFIKYISICKKQNYFSFKCLAIKEKY